MAVTAREALLKAESEADFQSWVIDLARVHGWLVTHMRDSRRQDVTGLPDLIMARRGVVLLVELKSETAYARKGHSLRKGQPEWIAASNGEVWCPSMRPVAEAVLR